MNTRFRTLATRLGLATALAASALVAAAPASARDYYRHRGDGDDATIAIGAGIIGLAVGAAIADHDDDRYYDRGYYESRRYVTVRGYPGYYYYYDGYPNRYYRDRYYDRYYAPYYRERWSRGRDWQDRRDWGRDRHRWDHHNRDWDHDRDRNWDRDRDWDHDRDWRR